MQKKGSEILKKFINKIFLLLVKNIKITKIMKLLSKILNLNPHMKKLQKRDIMMSPPILIRKNKK